MFGINEILEKAFYKKTLTKEEKIKILRSKRIDPKVIEYLIVCRGDKNDGCR